MTNVRRGEGDFSDKLLADIIVYDKTVIEEIESGRKREISCGYGCDYGINENGNILQINITGNHVALIEEGRAGHSVRILDHNKYKKGVVKTMAKMKTKKQIIARLFPSFAKDASTTPEEIQEIVTAINEVGDEEAEVPPAQESKPTADDDVLSKVLDGIQALKDEIGELKAANQQQNDPLKKLEQQLANEVASDNNEEVATDEDITEDDDDVTTDEDITEDDDEIAADEDVAEDDDITEDDDIETSDEKTTASAADKKAMLKLIRNIRPVIAKMKDGKQKKAVTDFLIKMARATSGKSRTPKKNGYADIMKVKQRRTSQFLAKDSKIYDDSQLGKQIAKQRNPHYKLS